MTMSVTGPRLAYTWTGRNEESTNYPPVNNNRQNKKKYCLLVWRKVLLKIREGVKKRQTYDSTVQTVPYMARVLERLETVTSLRFQSRARARHSFVTRPCVMKKWTVTRPCVVETKTFTRPCVVKTKKTFTRPCVAKTFTGPCVVKTKTFTRPMCSEDKDLH